MNKFKNKLDKKLIKMKYSEISEKMKMLQISNNSIQEGIINLMKGKEEFVDKTDNNDLLYSGDVFQIILHESYDADKRPQLSEKILGQLTELIILCRKYQYIMVIDNPK